MDGKKTIIHWIRKGQRVHDNPSFFKACEIARQDPNCCLRPIFILDPDLPKWMNVGPNRFRFLQQSLIQLNENLKKINSCLYVVRGAPQEVLPRLFREWNATVLTYESDIEPYAVKRDAAINNVASSLKIKVMHEHSHTVFNPEAVLRMNLGRAPKTYSSFMATTAKMKKPEPVQVPEFLPDTSVPPKDKYELEDSSCYDPPTLEQVVHKPEDLGQCKFPGGETEALARMEQYLSKTKYICEFEKPNTSPNSLDASTTVLSPYLKFGCLSSRLFYNRLQEILSQHPKHTKPPVSLLGQLLWREFYYTAAASEPNFDKMKGNKICYQIPWTTNDAHLDAWAYGRTGYPFIDAIMRQLRQEGWIHHLARHAVACFLTRGDLWISWEQGQKVFEDLLLDADWALNAGNWMWLSASAFFYQYFRVYSPVAFGKKTDKDGNYIRKYVPELRKYPAGIIYEPWKASLAAQKEYGCVIGLDYPLRCVIHEEVSKINMAKMAEAYKANKKAKENGQQLNVSILEAGEGTSSKRKKDSNMASSSATKKTKKIEEENPFMAKFFKKS